MKRRQLLTKGERDRGDRCPGEGRAHVETDLIHTFGPYDLDVDTTHGVSSALTESVLAAWRTRDRREPCCPEHPTREESHSRIGGTTTPSRQKSAL